jgi:hypothetical protein
MFTRYMVPVDENSCRAFLFSSRRATGLAALLYRIRYRLWASWTLLKFFIGQDTVVFGLQDYDAPEQLSGTDTGIVKWRRVIVDHASREGRNAPSPAPGSMQNNVQEPAISDVA